mmetsp:Transcript_34798/g.78437  ORF Transcript_34798/g.78437 Transcript_34798/m.78437 type:complete len:82 (-) Transcript_34798:3-248(-)
MCAARLRMPPRNAPGSALARTRQAPQAIAPGRHPRRWILWARMEDEEDEPGQPMLQRADVRRARTPPPLCSAHADKRPKAA